MEKGDCVSTFCGRPGWRKETVLVRSVDVLGGERRLR